MNAIGVPSWTLNGAALLAAYVLAISAATYLVYAADKSAAERGRWRVSERTLHMWSLLGGWPGALLAQRALRHKTRKDEFLSRFRWTVAANCGCIGLAIVVVAPSIVGFGGETWRIAVVAGETLIGKSEAEWWEVAVGALAGAVSMTVLRIRRMGLVCLALPAVTAVAAFAAIGIDGFAVLSDRILAMAGRHSAGVIGAVAGQVAVVLLGAGSGIRT